MHIIFVSQNKRNKKGRKEKVGEPRERRFDLYQHICMIYLSRKIHRKSITFFAYQNMTKLQPIGLLKKWCTAVLISWENQTVLQCLKNIAIVVVSEI